jgi:hypothetical protein
MPALRAEAESSKGRNAIHLNGSFRPFELLSLEPPWDFQRFELSALNLKLGVI